MPNNFDLKMKLSQILYQEDMNGIPYIEKAIEFRPNDSEALLLYGKMLVKEKDAAHAEKIIQKAI